MPPERVNLRPVLSKLLAGEPRPQIPKTSPEIEKYMRDMDDYLRRLGGRFTTENIINTIIEEYDLYESYTDVDQFIEEVTNVTNNFTTVENNITEVTKLAFQYGKLMSDFTTGSTVDLDPCDVRGVDNGESKLSPYVQSDKSSYTMYTGTKLTAGDILPFAIAANGEAYLAGNPRTELVDFQVDGANKELELRFRDSWGLFVGTTSSWVVVHTGDDC